MFCPHCGKESTSEEKFCYECGTIIKTANNQKTNNSNYQAHELYNPDIFDVNKYKERDEKISKILSIASIIMPTVTIVFSFLVGGSVFIGILIAYKGIDCAIKSKKHGALPIIGIILNVILIMLMLSIYLGND